MQYKDHPDLTLTSFPLDVKDLDDHIGLDLLNITAL